MYVKITVWVLLVFIMNVTNAQEDNFEKAFYKNRNNLALRDKTFSSPNTVNYDLKYYRFDLHVNPEKYYLQGCVTPYFTVLDTTLSRIYFDFASTMNVDSVFYHGKKVKALFSGDFELEIDLDTVLLQGQFDSLTICYSGVPDGSGFGSFVQGYQKCDNTKPLVWTLSEPYGARDWWPTKQSLTDKIDSIDMIVTTPPGNKVGSNGILVKVDTVAGMLVHHWKHRYPEAAYLIAISVTDYDSYIDWVPLPDGDSLMVLEYVFPCNLEDAMMKSKEISDIMLFYIDKFGEYPYVKEKYGHAQFGWGGGMEHSTMTFLGKFNHLLLAHELAHQWFGDKITCGSWQDIWLNEGFATYLEGLTYDFGRDPESWEAWKSKNLERALKEPHGSVYVYDTTWVGRIFNGNLSYSKGAFLLHMLRWKMGDDNFFQAIRDYLNDPALAYNYARTSDLQRHLEAKSGLNLSGFFQDWLYGKGYPIYSIYWRYGKKNTLKIRINQTQTDESVEYFEMPVPLLLKGDNGKDTLVVLDNEYNNQLFEINPAFEVKDIVFDPDTWLCAKVGEIKNFKSAVWLYPNPVADIVNVFLEEPAFIKEATLYDLSGKKLQHFIINEQTRNLVLKLPQLNYSRFQLLQITTDKGVFLKKIVRMP